MARKKEAPKTLGEQLEEALVANPDDLATHGAYADWLLEQGDPRGEFIGVQIDLEDESRPAKERKKLQKREAALLKEHGRKWLGELAPFLLDQQGIPKWIAAAPGHSRQFQFRRGWLASLTLNDLDNEFAAALASSSRFRLLREFVVSRVERLPRSSRRSQGKAAGRSTLSLLNGAEWLSNLRVFQLGDRYLFGGEDNRFESDTADEIGLDVLNLIKEMPQIEEIYIGRPIRGVDKLFAMKSLCRLKVLQIVSNNIDRDATSNFEVGRIAANRALAKLAYLILCPGREESFILVEAVSHLLRSPHLSSLTHLGLLRTFDGDRICEEVVASGILQRLKVLDLSRGSISDKGAQVLAKSPDLNNLELLVLNRNEITKDGIRALRKTGIQFQVEEQHEPGQSDDFDELDEYDDDWE